MFPTPSFRRNTHRRGQGLTEYILIVALVAIASIGVVSKFGNNIRSIFGVAADAIAGVQDAPNRAKLSDRAQETKTMGDFPQRNGAN
ncbi:MAG: hypothetical protein K1X64_07210 [Myxococcaceae bacterium]|nr:hypothetical protein [Myxococcaceae bacterium]